MSTPDITKTQVLFLLQEVELFSCLSHQEVFKLVQQIREKGYTVLIVEQNIQQVLKVVDRAYLLEVGRIKTSGSASELLGSEEIRKAYIGV